jgi:hydroxymethylpyrimidine/phosphomethylpyrimidine kinase
MARVYKALTIAGSDSGGGAGIQADLKTFAALGIHGMSVITSITAQNTKEVTKIVNLSKEIVREQIEVVAKDIGIDAAKTGMLHNSEIINIVAEEVERYKFPLVVDPVMVAKSGVKLLKDEAISALKHKLIPLAYVLTPNAKEAEVLSGLKVKSVDDAKRASKEIANLGVKAVVVKGGHLKENKAFDVLYYQGEYLILEEEIINTNTIHGTGCTFSAAIAAELAKGKDIPIAVRIAKEFVTNAIKFGLKIGRGYGPVNPTAQLLRDAEKYRVIECLSNAVEVIEQTDNIGKLIPETQSNLVMAIPFATSKDDIAGILGRIVRIGSRAKASSCPRFGASKHVANTLLTVMKYNDSYRSAMNIRYSERFVKELKSMGLKVSWYDRSKEPKEVREKEGMSTIWGAEQACKMINAAPDVIYHKGDVGKEPMITIIGKDAIDVVKRVIALLERIR